ncbi:armadillo-type protein [Pavlovales sp. CCMP2436]|nr:armadillo-type protein [Pavlovales sp. CCMP2436]
MSALTQTQIGWNSYEAAGIISREQLEMLYCYDKQPIATQVALFMQRGEAYVELFVVILQNVNKDETVQYVLALLDDALIAKPELGLYWHELLRNSGAEVDPFAPVMRLLGRTNSFILEKAALVLGRLLSLKVHTLGMEVEEVSESDEVTQRHLLTFTEWIFHQLNSAHSLELSQCPKLHYALSAMMALLVSDQGRYAVMQCDGLAVITQMLARATAAMHDGMSPSTVQLLYQLVFCLWCLSFNKKIADLMATGELKVISQLVAVANSVSKEKVSRVCLMTLKNLLGHGSGHANDQMVQAGIMKVLGSLHGRKWADEDIAHDVEELQAKLELDVASLSTYDVYKAEILSGSLEWSPSHKSPKFWKDNVAKFSEGGYTLVATLVSVVKSESVAPCALAVACHDLGCFIQWHPDGRKIVSSMGAKAPLMQLLTHSDAQVQKHALSTTQKLMVMNWELLSK